MKKKTKQRLCAAAVLLAAFVLYTLAVALVDVRPIGPRGSSVGFAAVNGWFHGLTGVRMSLYVLTDWLGLVPIGVAAGFALLGLAQWIQRKDLRKVDRSLLVLGGFYLAVMAAYVFFELLVINRRPVLIDGRLEASYPSSTTVLVLCVMSGAVLQLRGRIRNSALRRCVMLSIAGFSAFMVIGRLLSGVHWLSDILGGALLSAGLVMLYHAAAETETQ